MKKSTASAENFWHRGRSGVLCARRIYEHRVPHDAAGTLERTYVRLAAS